MDNEAIKRSPASARQQRGGGAPRPAARRGVPVRVRRGERARHTGSVQRSEHTAELAEEMWHAQTAATVGGCVSALME